KTMIMQAIANAITHNNPECHLMVVLVDERPEPAPARTRDPDRTRQPRPTPGRGSDRAGWSAPARARGADRAG
ncbi:hypothetical protein ABZZ80_36460, partial [Streptomyces sp. NPDC006356]